MLPNRVAAPGVTGHPTTVGQPTPWSRSAHRWEELSLAFVLTVCASLFPRWGSFQQIWVADRLGLGSMPREWYSSFLFLGFGLLLTLPSRHRSGLRVGELRAHWPGVLLVCGGAVLATALVYPLLPVRPWGGAPITMWLISPLAQSLIFIGYLFGRLRRAFPGYLHPRLPIERGLMLTFAFFALWHVPNFLLLPAGYVVFQLFYTGVLGIVPALSRQWTGSIWYAALAHSCVNFIAWIAP